MLWTWAFVHSVDQFGDGARANAVLAVSERYAAHGLDVGEELEADALLQLDRDLGEIVHD